MEPKDELLDESPQQRQLMALNRPLREVKPRPLRRQIDAFG